MLNRLNPRFVYTLEAALIGVFFLQALRFLVGELYHRVAGATVVLATDPTALDPNLPGVVEPAVVRGEITLLVYMLALPVLTVLLGRVRPLLTLSAIAVALARLLMLVEIDITSTVAASVTVGAGLFYIGMMIRQRAQTLPYLFVLGLTVDQLFRAFGDTLDPSWSPTFQPVQIGLSSLAIILALVNFLLQDRARRGEDSAVSPDYGLMPFWGGVGLGALLFMHLALLGAPNAIAGRADVDYTFLVPLVMAATTLPLLPGVRAVARRFVALFDSSVRGWVWLLLTALLLVFGLRIGDLIGGVTLVVAQFMLTMLWWWVARPKAERERNLGGLWLVVSIFVFALLLAGDFFTYEYAFVRNFTGDLAFLNNFLTPLLRGFRGMGLGVLLVGLLLAALPMVMTQRRIPWGESRASVVVSFLTLLLVIGVTGLATYLARPPLVQGVTGVDRLRVGTYNIHAGSNELFHYDLEAIANVIQQSGVNVVLLQEVEAGRLTSYGVDQPLWLARRLGMDRRFFPTNEGLQGLAVLSNVPIVFDEGTPLTSVGNQTGVQRVQISADGGVSAITFYNTWLGLLLDAPGGRTLETQQQDQQRQLNEILAIIQVDHPDGVFGRMVVGGTFNNVPDSPTAEQMTASGFSDPFAGAALELAATLWRSNARARLDYLWLRNLPSIGTGVIDDNASDHRLAFTEVEIGR